MTAGPAPAWPAAMPGPVDVGNVCEQVLANSAQLVHTSRDRQAIPSRGGFNSRLENKVALIPETDTIVDGGGFSVAPYLADEPANNLQGKLRAEDKVVRVYHRDR